jgi:hypothetical protein
MAPESLLEVEVGVLIGVMVGLMEELLRELVEGVRHPAARNRSPKTRCFRKDILLLHRFFCEKIK